MVVGLHVAGLSLVLLQGCGKDSVKSTASNTDTNTPSLGYPGAMDTNLPSSMFANATNTGSPSLARANTNVLAPAIGTPAPGLPSNLTDGSMPAPQTGMDQPAPSGPQKDYKIQKGD